LGDCRWVGGADVLALAVAGAASIAEKMYHLFQSSNEYYWRKSIGEVVTRFSGRIPTHYSLCHPSFASLMGGEILPCNQRQLTWKDWCLRQAWAGHDEPLEYREDKTCFLVVPGNCLMTSIKEVAISTGSNQLVFYVYEDKKISRVYSLLFAGDR
jgi:hypothetical protein